MPGGGAPTDGRARPDLDATGRARYALGMSVRSWAIKVGELKRLSRAELVLLSGRCALRVAPWVPPGAEVAWGDGLAFVVGAALATPTDATAERARALRDLGARACNQLEATDEPLGRCLNHAAGTLAAAIEATALPLGPELKKAVIETAKQSASIPALLAHAGRVGGVGDRDAVDVAGLAIWDAIRADIAALEGASARPTALGDAGDAIEALRAVAPLWPTGAPDWAHR